MRSRSFTGWIFCALLAALTAACDRKQQSPEWENQPAAETRETQSAPTPRRTSAKPPDPAKNPGHEPLRFIAYNVENWLIMDREIHGKTVQRVPKPESEKKALTAIVSKHRPDVLGLCEIGGISDLQEIQSRLKAAGLDLPHTYHTGGTDPVRHLALLSRHPIQSTNKAIKLDYQMNGKSFGFNRGILDATIESNGKSYRFIGAHLKSKRDTEEGDQEQMRVHEAHLLRSHIDRIFQSTPDARLIVYGDFNDTYPSKAVRAIIHDADETRSLSPVYLKDSRGDAWTHHWKHQDLYSRIDFVTCSKNLKSEVNFKASHIIDDPSWDEASDHRPLLVVFN